MKTITDQAKENNCTIVEYENIIQIDNLPNSLVTLEIETYTKNFIINPMPESINTIRISGIEEFDINKFNVPNKEYMIINYCHNDMEMDDNDIVMSNKITINYY